MATQMLQIVGFNEFSLKFDEVLVDEIIYQMIVLKLKPERLLEVVFNLPVLEGTPKDYIKYLKRISGITARLVEELEDNINVDEDAPETAELENRHFREMQIFILKKQEALIKFIHAKLGTFLTANVDKLEEVLAETKGLDEMVTDFSFFVAICYQDLYKNLTDYTIEWCRSRFADVDPEDFLSLHFLKQNDLQDSIKEIALFFDAQKVVLTHVEEEDGSNFEDTLKNWQELQRIILEKHSKVADLLNRSTPVAHDPILVQDYQNFKQQFDEIKNEVRLHITWMKSPHIVDPGKIQALLGLNNKCAQFLGAIKEFRRKYENIVTLFNLELTFSEKTVTDLMLVLRVRYPMIQSVIPQKPREENPEEKVGPVRPSLQQITQKVEACILKMKEALGTHDITKEHVDSTLQNIDQVPKNLSRVTQDLKRLVALNKKVSDLEFELLGQMNFKAISKEFLTLRSKMADAEQEAKAFIETLELLHEADKEQKGKGAGKDKGKSINIVKKDPKQAKPKGRKKKRKIKQKKKQSNSAAAASAAAATLPEQPQLYSVMAGGKKVDIYFPSPPVPKPKSTESDEECETEDLDEGFEQEETDKKESGDKIPTEGIPIMQASTSHTDTSLVDKGASLPTDASPDVVKEPVLTGSQPHSLGVDSSSLPSAESVADPKPESIAGAETSERRDSLENISGMQAPSMSATPTIASLNRGLVTRHRASRPVNMDAELNDKKQALEVLDTELSKRNSAVYATQKRLRTLNRMLATSHVTQQALLNNTQNSQPVSFSAPVLFRVFPGSYLVPVYPLNPIPMSEFPMQPVMVVPVPPVPIRPPIQYQQETLEWSGRGRGRGMSGGR